MRSANQGPHYIWMSTPSGYHSLKEKLDKMLEKLKKLDVKSAT